MAIHSVFFSILDHNVLLWLMLLLMLLPMQQMGERDVSNFWRWK